MLSVFLLTNPTAGQAEQFIHNYVIRVGNIKKSGCINVAYFSSFFSPP